MNNFKKNSKENRKFKDWKKELVYHKMLLKCIHKVKILK